jgi:hypothetical protein
MEKKKIDKVIEAFRHYIELKEDGGMVVGPTNNVSGGKIAGTPQADPGNPPVDLRKGKRRNWNPFFKNLATVQRRNLPK